MENAVPGIRLVAAIIDYVVLFVIAGVLFVVGVGAALATEEGAASLPFLLLIYLMWPLYYIVLTAMTGATLGKMLMGIKVVDANGNKPGIGTVLMREVIGKLISGLIIYIGYIWIIFDAQAQGWHDKIAATFVVKAR